MFYEREVKFKEEGRLPSPEEVLERVREWTGLSDLELIKGDHNKFVHDEFPDMFFVFYQEGSSYKLLIDNGNATFHLYNYMVEATIGSLFEIGGTRDSKLWDWTYKKWAEVRHIVLITSPRI
jgi:hypothetical protein